MSRSDGSLTPNADQYGRDLHNDDWGQPGRSLERWTTSDATNMRQMEQWRGVFDNAQRPEHRVRMGQTFSDVL